MEEIQTSHRLKAYVALSSLFAFIGLGAVIFRTLEGWTWIQSFYFTVVTLTTVGYGDMHPTSDISRLVAVFYILIGVAVAVTAVSMIGSYYIERREIKVSKRLQDIYKKTQK